MKVVAIVQARMGSTRLPGKVLMDIAGKTMLERVVERVCAARRIDEVVVATSTAPSDDAIVALCDALGVRWFRGSEEDVLDRYHGAALEAAADVVVRVTSDCPLIEPGIIDRVVDALQTQPDLDFAANTLEPRTFPRGLDVEAMRMAALETTCREAQHASEREHVTPFIWQQPKRFKLGRVCHDTDLSALRWTVDTPEDLAFVRAIFEHLPARAFAWGEVLRLLDAKPELTRINAGITQKPL